MKVKKIVKVMNFQTLLHINSAKKKADKYQHVGEEITGLIKKIIYNKNIVLDKKGIMPDPKNPKLDIYIANDYGFCGDFNASIRHQIRENKDNYKIIIGKKILTNDEKTLLKINKEDFQTRLNEIEDIVDEALEKLSYSEINLYYNHYYSMDHFEFKKLQLFPVEFDGTYYEGKDYVSETNTEKLLKGLMTFYICYQVKVAEAISVAAENVLRNQITNLALDKIEQKEQVLIKIERKEKLKKTIMKNVENYKRIREGENS